MDNPLIILLVSTLLWSVVLGLVCAGIHIAADRIYETQTQTDGSLRDALKYEGILWPIRWVWNKITEGLAWVLSIGGKFPSVGQYLKRTLRNPIFDCANCMVSFWGLILYLTLQEFGFDISLFVAVCGSICASSLAGFFRHKL